LTPQQLKTKTLPSTDAFGNLLGAHATLTRELSAALVASHGLTINDYGTLLLLSRAGEEGMRRIDLANELQLSPSGITRLLDRLEEQGLVGKGACKEDARVSYAILTDAGRDKLREAAPGHVDDIERRITTVLSDEEIQTLNELLGRFTEATGQDCTPDECSPASRWAPSGPARSGPPLHRPDRRRGCSRPGRRRGR
jgi:MarR family transcriptional regulator, 2-MHQ and catechol-resistance regulon repressor